MIDFLFQIDGRLLQACYDPNNNNNNNTPLEQMSKNVKDIIDNEKYKEYNWIPILQFSKSIPVCEIDFVEKDFLIKKDYVNLFKRIICSTFACYYQKKSVLPLYYRNPKTTEKLPLFEHCHAVYVKIKAIHEELTAFFNKQGNEEHSNKYKTVIDDKMNKIDDFLKIPQIKNTSI